MLRHAYLILIHEDSLVLRQLIQLLDYEDCDFYIHVDRQGSYVDREILQACAEKSKVFIYRKYKVHWGTNSITNAELYLLKQAIKGKYDYYHILSGADLPIKSKNQIMQFFENNNGKEFVHFGTKQYQNDIQQRYNVYHFFSKQLGRKRDKKLWVDLETYSLAIQRRLKIDRTRKKDFSFYGGSNWCSITSGFAEYAVKNYSKYKKAFWATQISDEAVWQTILMDSPYHDKLYISGFDNNYNACLRYIDWNRGTPYVFKNKDFDELMASNCIFARKFDSKTDKDIIEKIYRKLGV